jgi:hypothetical protein
MRKKKGEVKMKTRGTYWKHPSVLYDHPRCICGRVISYSRRGKDLVRSCALCTHIPVKDTEPSNPQPRILEFNSTREHVGPSRKESPKLIRPGRKDGGGIM